MRPGETAVGPNNITSAAYEAGHLVKATPGRLYGFSGYNSKTAAQFIQVHDAASLPGEGAVPAVIINVGAQSNFSFDTSETGRLFAVGIYIVNSSTGPTKTIGSADCWYDVQFT